MRGRASSQPGGSRSERPDAEDESQDASPAATVVEVLRGYAERGLFAGVSPGETRRGRRHFRVRWHHQRNYAFVLDPAAGTLSFPQLLPGIPAGSAMARELREFVGRFNDGAMPEHRRIDPAMGRLSFRIHKGSAALTMAVRDDHYEYCTRRLIHVVHEVFMVFLWDGPYYDYRVEHLGLNPDTGRP